MLAASAEVTLAPREWAEQAYTVKINDAVAAQAKGTHPNGHAPQPLPFLFTHAQARGRPLRAGDLVTTGAWFIQKIQAGDVVLVVNTPHGTTSGGSPRVDGYEIRTASVVANIACITTVQGLAATVQALEATRTGRLGVRSLQSWAARRAAG